MKKLALLCLSLGLICAAGHSAEESDDGLYYAARENFATASQWELRAGAGYDYSNSFLTIYAFQGSALYLLDPTMAVGIEGTGYAHAKKGSGEAFADELKKFGYDMYAVAPLWKTTAAYRLTPISGMVNLFSQRIMKVDLSLIARAGVIRYQTVGYGPTFGAGLETSLGITPTVGVNFAIHWDYEKPGTIDWLWRAGFMVGPTFRF